MERNVKFSTRIMSLGLTGLDFLYYYILYTKIPYLNCASRYSIYKLMAYKGLLR
jgi:hypothetical protein